MKKVLPYLGASLSLLAAAWATSAKAQDATSFKDVDSSHWAYQAVTDLQQKGILTGYPDGYFRGKRTLTRYEFAIALERALSKVQAQVGPAGPQGPAGDAGPAGPQGPPGVTPDELKELQALTQEFKNDLAQLGANVKDIQNRLDALAKDLADLKDAFNRAPKVFGDVFFGVRSNRSRTPFFDYSGAYQGASNTLTGNVAAVHDVHLGVTANLPGNVKALVDTVFSNYLGYRENNGIFLGGPAAALQSGNEEVGIYQAALQIPIGSFGYNTTLTVGRYKNQVTPLTYYRPDTDAYFDLPWYDDGNYVEDGFKLESKFGSASTQVFAGSYASTTTSSGIGVLNAPIVGATYGVRAFDPFKPTGLNYPNQGQLIPKESLGLHIGIPLFKLGEIGLTAIDFGGGTLADPQVAPYYNNVVVYGANITLKQLGRFAVSGEAAKSVPQIGIGANNSVNSSNDKNNAYTLNVGWNSKGLGLQAGYQYIDPNFAAPGYWNKIGNWYNPTNISGPFVRANYHLNNALLLTVGGDYYSGARNAVGITKGSNLYRGTAGVKYVLNKIVSLSADYEGVMYDFSNAVSLTAGRANLVEQYITLGAGLNLASNTVLKLGYQMINQQNVDGSFGGIVGSGGQLTQNAGVFTTQLAVHF
jgi:hypothetical protein